MIAVDTNVLVRIIVDDADAKKQVVAARRLAAKAGEIYLSQIVQVELVWVLKSAYQFTKTQVLKVLEHLMENTAFILQDEKCYVKALKNYHQHNCDFSDSVIWAKSQEDHLKLYTFDKKFTKVSNVIDAS